MKTIISGICSLTFGDRMSRINGGYILNGDIEKDENGNEIYIEDNSQGERSILIKDMPYIVQEYISKNKKVIA